MNKLLAALVILGSTAGVVSADETTTADNDCKRARKQGKTCQLSFDTPEDVQGTVQTPTGEGTGITESFKFTSLIRMRWDFRAEIIRTLENF